MSDLLKFMQTESAIEKLLFLLPKERQGLQPIATCLFSESVELQKQALKVLLRVRISEIGSRAFNSLPEFYKIKMAAMIN